MINIAIRNIRKTTHSHHRVQLSHYRQRKATFDLILVATGRIQKTLVNRPANRNVLRRRVQIMGGFLHRMLLVGVLKRGPLCGLGTSHVNTKIADRHSPKTTYFSVRTDDLASEVRCICAKNLYLASSVGCICAEKPRFSVSGWMYLRRKT